MVEYASRGLGGAALGTGVAGLSLGVLNSLGGGGLLNGLLGGGTRVVSADDMPVTRGEANLMKENATLKAENAQKDAYIYTDQQVDAKLEKVIGYFKREHDDLEREVRRNKDDQTAINMQQAVYNGTNTATISCLKGQVDELLALTKRVVPNGSVCPGWGNVTVTPSTAAAAATPATGA